MSNWFQINPVTIIILLFSFTYMAVFASCKTDILTFKSLFSFLTVKEYTMYKFYKWSLIYSRYIEDIFKPKDIRMR